MQKKIRRCGRMIYSIALWEGDGMANVTAYSALAGKTKAMYGRMLERNDYIEIMHKRSVMEITAYLKRETCYAEVLKNDDENTIHRGHLENALKRALMTDYDKLISFTNGNIRAFIKIVYKRHEIECLKLLFRAFGSNTANPSMMNDSLLFLTRCDNVNIPKLVLSRNSSEFVNGLMDTEYYKVLRPFINDNCEFHLFNIEMALDSYFYQAIYHAMKKYFTGEDAEIVDRLYGMEIDLFNMFTIYRSKVFFKMEKDIINTYLIPYHASLSKAHTEALLDAPDKEALLKICAQTRYASVFQGSDERRYEVQMQNYLLEMNRSMFKQKIFTIASVLSYIKLKEAELKNLISMIEGIRYGLQENVLRNFVSGFDHT